MTHPRLIHTNIDADLNLDYKCMNGIRQRVLGQYDERVKGKVLDHSFTFRSFCSAK